MGVIKLVEAAKVTANIKARGLSSRVFATSTAMGNINTTEALLERISVSKEVVK